MSRRKILVVDDSAVWLETVSTILGDQHDLTLTADPDEAISLARLHDFSVAVIDQRLGAEWSGTELIARLRLVRPSLRAVILTGYASVDDAVESMSAGAADYISKGAPDMALELQTRVAKAVLQPESTFLAYLQTQLKAQTTDPDYQHRTYVTQRIRVMHDDHEEQTVDAVSTVHGWLIADSPSFVVLLGEPGSGKTLFLYELARQLTEHEDGPVPILIPLRELERPGTLDALITKHLADLGVERIDLRATRELLEQGRLVLLLDGLDELSFRAAHQDVADYLEMIVRGASGKAKVVLTSREHVASDQQLPVYFQERRHPVPGLRVCALQPLTTEQISEFLQRRGVELPNELFGSVYGLASLATNPRMLGLISTMGAQLPRVTAHARPGEIVARIYELLISRWIERDDDRNHPADVDAILPNDAQWAILTAIANRLWRKTAQSATAADLLEEASTALRSLNTTGIDPELFVNMVGTQTLLQRDAQGLFFFRHRAILEWLVANGAAKEMRQGISPVSLEAVPVTEPVFDFLVALAGEGPSIAWARSVLADVDRFGPHATALAQRLLQVFPENASGAKAWKPEFSWLDWLNGAGDESIVSRLAPEAFRSPTLRIHTLRIRNIRGFADSGEISFCDSAGASRTTTLLLGDNAAGKSTLLQCLTIAFLGPALASRLDTSPERLLRHKARSGLIEAEFSLEDHSLATDAPGSFFVGIELRAGEVSFRAADRADCSLLRNRDSSFTNAAPRIDAIRRLDHGAFGFMCAYGPWRNLNVEPNTSLTQHQNDVLDRVFSLFHSETLVMDPDLLGRLLSGDLANVKSPSSAALSNDARRTLIETIGTLVPNMSTSDDATDAPLVMHGVPLTLRSLSDGYGSLLALVGHVFRHSLGFVGRSAHPQALRAMILIDEIDLHLHPSWQRRIVADLRRAFPDAQLVYSSHSPMVAGSTPPASIVLLKREGDRIDVRSDLESVQGWRADQILTSMLFDLESSRDIETSQLIRRYTHLSVAAALSAEEQDELRGLAAQLRIRLPTSDEKSHARKAFEMIEATCRKEFDALSAADRELLVTELQAQLLESVTQSRRPE